jgi:nicotinamidase-related amidase
MADSKRPLTALVVVDVQRDFCEGGVLPARSTTTLIGPLNALTGACAAWNVPIVFTRDWHPPDHSSFQAGGGRWPAHCVRGTPGAEFAPGLKIAPGATIIDKGVDRDAPGYSAFETTDLARRLADSGVTGLAVCGIATEYCVLESVKDARRLGFGVILLEDLIRPIDASPGDAERAVCEMQALGVERSSSARWHPSR